MTRSWRSSNAKIRQVLIEHCYKCHASDARNILGGLLLDSRAGILTGGDSAAAVVPSKPDEIFTARLVKEA